MRVKFIVSILAIAFVTTGIVLFNSQRIEKKQLEFLSNDEELIEYLSNEDWASEYPYIVLWSKVEDRSTVDAFRNPDQKPTKYNRLFTAWKYPKDSIPLEENSKLIGFVNQEKQVYIMHKLRGDQYLY